MGNLLKNKELMERKSVSLSNIHQDNQNNQLIEEIMEKQSDQIKLTINSIYLDQHEEGGEWKSDGKQPEKKVKIIENKIEKNEKNEKNEKKIEKKSEKNENSGKSEEDLFYLRNRRNLIVNNRSAHKEELRKQFLKNTESFRRYNSLNIFSDQTIERNEVLHEKTAQNNIFKLLEEENEKKTEKNKKKLKNKDIHHLNHKIINKLNSQNDPNETKENPRKHLTKNYSLSNLKALNSQQITPKNKRNSSEKKTLSFGVVPDNKIQKKLQRESQVCSYFEYLENTETNDDNLLDLSSLSCKLSQNQLTSSSVSLPDSPSAPERIWKRVNYEDKSTRNKHKSFGFTRVVFPTRPENPLATRSTGVLKKKDSQPWKDPKEKEEEEEKK